MYETFAAIDGDECRRQLIHLAPPASILESYPIAADQMVFVASSAFGPHSGSKRSVCHYCGVPGHTKDRCFKLHPELKQQYAHNCTMVSPCIDAIVDIASSPHS